MARPRKPRLLEVCPFEWEAVVRPKHTNDPPCVLMLYRESGGSAWNVYVDKPRSNKVFADRAEAFDYVNTEYEDAR
jgi:hypothetical protein